MSPLGVVLALKAQPRDMTRTTPEMRFNSDKTFHVKDTSTLNPSYQIVMGQKFEEIEGGGSLMLAWQVRNKRVLVVGGGEVLVTTTQIKQY